MKPKQLTFKSGAELYEWLKNAELVDEIEHKKSRNNFSQVFLKKGKYYKVDYLNNIYPKKIHEVYPKKKMIETIKWVKKND